MSSDLTFITNEEGRRLGDRLGVLLRDNSRAFDCLVGYFYLSGFRRLVQALERTEKIRILVGRETDRPTFNLLSQAKEEPLLNIQSHAEVKESVPNEILIELENADDSKDVELGVRQFVDWAKSGKLEVRAFPTAMLHAKVYVMTFVEGHIDKGRVITGSSNLSQSGLVENLEFNVELKNRSDYDFALQKFNELWSQAVDVSETYVQTVELRSQFAPFSPYELFLKFLYEHFRSELSSQERTEVTYVPPRFMKLKYQEDAVTTARRTVDEYGGVFLSDVVGLGKTYVAALLAQQLPGRTLVIAPPALLDESNPGSWPNVFRDFRVPQTRFQSIGKLEELLRQGVERYENVFIDESHRFRTETNETYERLARICRGKRIILVTATPLNNHPRDILSQIKLFQSGKASTVPNVRDLEAFFGRLSRRLKGLDRLRDREQYVAIVRQNAREIRERILKYLMVRRTRTEIARYYAADLAVQGLRFPEVADPEPLFYQLNPEENRIFVRTIERLARDFTFARYRPLTYYVGDRRPDSDAVAQRNLARIMRVLLVKRLESSFHAFRLTLKRFVRTYELALRAFGTGSVFISKKHVGKIFELLEQDDMEAVQDLIDAEAAERLPASDFAPDFQNDLERDLAILYEIRDQWTAIDRDPKWLELSRALRERTVLRDGQVVIFTESKETAVYLGAQLENELHEKVVVFTGDSDASVREKVIRNFDARIAPPANDFRILVTTEVLAEGVSLHRANVVVNYDIPWNPTRLMQRVGRVNRVDTRHDQVWTFHFFPTEQGNDIIKLREAAEAKIHGFIEMLGADAHLLTEGEEIKSHDLFQQLVARSTLTGEDEQQESELEYLSIIRRIRDEEPALFERIKRLPRKARSAKATTGPDPTPALLTYFRKDQLEKFFLAGANSRTRELDFLEVARCLSCAVDVPTAKVGQDFYPLLDRNKSAFDSAVAEDAHGTPVRTSRDAGVKLLQRLRAREIRNFPGYTEEDEEYIRRVTRLLEDGSLPRPTLKRISQAFRTEADARGLLGILRRHIPHQFLESLPTERTRRTSNRREVILSEYLVPEGQ